MDFSSNSTNVMGCGFVTIYSNRASKKTEALLLHFHRKNMQFVPIQIHFQNKITCQRVQNRTKEQLT